MYNVFENTMDYRALREATDLVKNYTIEDGILSVPVETMYEMVTPYMSFNFGKTPLNWQFNRYRDNIDSLIEQFLHDQDAVMNWMEDQKEFKNDGIANRGFINPNMKFQIVKKEKVVMIKGATNEADEYLRTEYWISNDVVLEGEEVINMIKAHPKYQAMVDRANNILAENIKIAEIAERERKETIRRNAYETWKILESKRKNGEFDEFID